MLTTMVKCPYCFHSAEPYTFFMFQGYGCKPPLGLNPRSTCSLFGCPQCRKTFIDQIELTP